MTYTPPTTPKPRLLARHLWCLRRAVRRKCGAETWQSFLDFARKDDEAEAMIVMHLHWGFGTFIRNGFLYRGPWRTRLKRASGIRFADADDISTIILTWLVWSVRRRAPSLTAAQEFVDSGCWTRRAQMDLLIQSLEAAAPKPAASKPFNCD